jgi:hypothetical protein
MIRVVFVAVTLLVVQLIFSSIAVVKTRMRMEANVLVENSRGWNEPESRQLIKDLYWVEQLVDLAQSDSISMTVNLEDSVIQIGLKGLVLFETKILKQYPDDFPGSQKKDVYFHFATLSSIVSEFAGIPKKPVRKMAVMGSGEGIDHQNEYNSHKPFYWSFNTGNDFRVILTGISEKEVSHSSFLLFKNLLLFKFFDFIKEPLNIKYKPILYLWVDEQDVKTIYRSQPSGGKVLFRN